MLPQLFVNYKLKSVAALPWRSFMYKAFNTFIDDIFAFIITMPTAHRLACFRDDIVFVIYLVCAICPIAIQVQQITFRAQTKSLFPFQYQRWLYPVDKTRLDDGTDRIATIVESSDDKQTTKETKKSKWEKLVPFHSTARPSPRCTHNNSMILLFKEEIKKIQIINKLDEIWNSVDHSFWHSHAWCRLNDKSKMCGHVSSKTCAFVMY